MPSPAVSLRDGSLSQHLDSVMARVRAAPGDADLRAQLFQLRAVQGDWKRAAEQLQLCAEMNAAAQPLAALYGQAIAAEQQRESVLSGQGAPAFIVGDKPAWCELLLQALSVDATDPARAAALRAQALEDAPTSAGALLQAGPDEARHAYAWICDGDTRLGPVCEWIGMGRYAWIPFEQIRRISLLPPEGLCDVLWAQAELELQSGRTLHGLVPARYPAPPGQSHAEQDERFSLGRVTEWRALAGDGYAGMGQKMWMTDSGEFALLDIRGLVAEGV